ncbi:MAG: hypothetical protein HY922_06805 [Elusimicrobia bacterium]|nr:hypothetical protein [Elusimicrobiota bacterium]
MRKNLTISLQPQDWEAVRRAAESLGETYSQLFHRIIHAFFQAGEVKARTVAKYRPMFAPHESFLADRARVFSRSRARKRGL